MTSIRHSRERSLLATWGWAVRVPATLRAIVLVVLLFGALICGLWAGMSWSTVLSLSERGVMDSPY
jgi:hypothetical protein